MPIHGMKRRAFIAALGGAAAWPLVARGQQRALPIIGFLSLGAPGVFAPYVVGFRRGLEDAGYIDGRNVMIEFRWAEGRRDKLAAFASELLDRGVAVFLTSGGAAPGLAAKAVTATIPIVALSGDLVADGLIATVNRPEGNITGISMLSGPLESKRMELLLPLLPNDAILAYLVDSTMPGSPRTTKFAQTAALTLGHQLLVVSAANEEEIEQAFATIASRVASGLVVAASPLFNARRDRLIALAAQYAIPTIYEWREFAANGGLMSYGTDLAASYALAGAYVGKILRGTKPAELPVIQPTTFAFVINLKTAKVLGLTVPPSLLARADEVIE
jgi:putative tryptophan/tyrosine transport system substrate-binding protein